MPVTRDQAGRRAHAAERGDCDVLICGASFAGLAVARELAGSGARTLIVDRYEIGERQTSACAAPTEWLEAMGVGDSIRQTFDTLVVHTPHTTARFRLPWTFSTFDYRELCGLLFEQCDAEFETATVEGRARGRRTVHTDRGDLVGAAASSTRSAGSGCWPATRISRPRRRSRAGSRSIRTAARDELEIWIDRGYVPAGYSWSFPARDEVRVGVGSFDPRFHVKEPTVRLARGPRARRGPLPGQLDPAQAAPGDRGRRLLRRRLGRPLPAADRRGHPHRLLLRHRLRPRAAPGRRRRDHGRAGAAPLRASSPTSTSGSSAGCCARSASCRGCRRGC